MAAITNDTSKGYGKFIKKMTLEKFLWCMRLEIGGEFD